MKRLPPRPQRSAVLASCRGVTLMELMVTSVIATFIILAFTSVDVSRIFLINQVRADAGVHTEIGYAMAHIIKNLEAADRIVQVAGSSSNVQLRVPLGDIDNDGNIIEHLDVAEGYDWRQYRLDGGTNEITFYDETEGGCADVSLLAQNITVMSINYVDTADPPLSSPPPGGEPSPPGDGRDNNVLRLTLTTTDPTTGTILTFGSTVVTRSVAYTNVPTGLTTAPALNPPAACT